MTSFHDKQSAIFLQLAEHFNQDSNTVKFVTLLKHLGNSKSGNSAQYQDRVRISKQVQARVDERQYTQYTGFFLIQENDNRKKKFEQLALEIGCL